MSPLICRHRKCRKHTSLRGGVGVGKGVLVAIFVEVATDQPGSNVGRVCIAFVAQYPASLIEAVVRNLFYLLQLPDLVIEVVELVDDRVADEMGRKDFACVLVQVAIMEVRLAVDDRDLPSAHSRD